MTDLDAPAHANRFSVRLPNHSASIRIALAALAADLRELGFKGPDIERLQMVVDEACVNVLKHAYRPGEPAEFEVESTLESGKIKIRIKDHGLPYDPFHAPQFMPESATTKGLGTYLMQSLIHELRFVNLGREGKAVELLYPLPGGWTGDCEQPEPSDDDEADPAPDGASLRVRLFRPEDAGQVARCAYHVYGYSYFGEHIYIPERLIAMNQTGDLISAVVVDDRERVFGHLALVFSPDRVIPEEGQAFVMPATRGGGWLKRLKQYLYDEAQTKGLPGVFSDGVTVHPYTQKANLAMDSRECGMALAFAPGNVQFNDIHAADDHRHSLVVFYKALTPDQRSRAYVPSRHVRMIAEIHDNLGITLEERQDAQPYAVQTILDTSANGSRGIAYLTVRQYGQDLVEQVAHQKKLLCCHGMSVLQLDLPMNHPACATSCGSLEELGFFFSGVVPHYFGDAPSLRLEYLNNVEIDASSIVLESDFAKRLFEYIQAGVPA